MGGIEAMSRPATGSVVERRAAAGRPIRLRFNISVKLGTGADGWTMEEAQQREAELRARLAACFHDNGKEK
jgi:hypothetical protein